MMAHPPRARRVMPRPAEGTTGAWPAASVAVALGLAAAFWGWLLDPPLALAASILGKTPAAPIGDLIDAVVTAGYHGMWLAPAGFVATQWLVRGRRGGAWVMATLVLVGVAVLVTGSGIVLAGRLLAAGSQGPADLRKLLAIVTAFIVMPAAYGWAAGALADGVVGVRYRSWHAFGAVLAGLGTVWGSIWLTLTIRNWPDGATPPRELQIAAAILALGYAAHAAMWRPR